MVRIGLDNKAEERRIRLEQDRVMSKNEVRHGFWRTPEDFALQCSPGELQSLHDPAKRRIGLSQPLFHLDGQCVWPIPVFSLGKNQSLAHQVNLALLDFLAIT